MKVKLTFEANLTADNFRNEIDFLRSKDSEVDALEYMRNFFIDYIYRQDIQEAILENIEEFFGYENMTMEVEVEGKLEENSCD